MTEVMQALNEVKDLYTKFLGQPAPEIGPGWYAPFPPGADPMRYAIAEVEELKKLLLHARTPQIPIAWIPRADVFAGREAVVIRLEIPGVKRDQLKVLVAEGECIVRGERPTPAEDKKLQPIGLEFPFGTFERRFALPMHAAPEKLTAKYADGILEVTVPIVELPAPKEMKVEIA
ncbi:MAG TPA: Hsp20/alpha crystallin family protein [Candidatus Polarisedimenticolaceae bacterium]|nr:Hsp20/alpha crystallin family protein [Candidatus Polarisedimenticolaceae bacterium]